MSKKLNSFIAVTALVFLAALCMGMQDCSDVKSLEKEYCKNQYVSKVDQAECNSYCASNPDFASDKTLVQACEYGQLTFLGGSKVNAAEPILVCERNLKDESVAKACRAGVMQEDLRTSKSRKTQGSASDRETGNNR